MIEMNPGLRARSVGYCMYHESFYNDPPVLEDGIGKFDAHGSDDERYQEQPPWVLRFFDRLWMTEPATGQSALGEKEAIADLQRDWTRKWRKRRARRRA